MIDELRKYLNSELFEPAINAGLDTNFVKTLKSTRTKLSHFKKVGDLYRYYTKILHHGDEEGKGLYQELKIKGLKTFEDLLPELKIKFSKHLNDTTELEDLKEGIVLTKIEICCLANNFNHFVGMWEIKFGKRSLGIIASAKFGEDYGNAWIEKDTKLKYILQKVDGRDTQVSKLAQTTEKLPIYVFENLEDNQYKFLGIFEKESSEKDFLILRKSPQKEKPILANKYLLDFDHKVEEGLNDTLPNLLQRLAKWENDTDDKYVVVRQIKRNPYVKSFALLRANGVCERCSQKAPFVKQDQSPYLEVHHIIMLSENGDDSINNTIALCPNCHRQLHFGEVLPQEINQLLEKIRVKNLSGF